MNFNKFYLTKDGRDLLNRTTMGEVLAFTRVAFGVGAVSEQSELVGLKALVDQRLSVPIVGTVNNHDGTCTVKVAFNNKEVIQGFSLREIGIFAQDPVKGEILYFVCNAGDNADFLPAYKTNLVEMKMDFIVVIGDTAEITVVIDESMIWATKEELLALAGVGRTDQSVKSNYDLILALMMDLASYKGAAVHGLGMNAFYVVFDGFDEGEEFHGVWDKDRSRLGVYPVIGG